MYKDIVVYSLSILSLILFVLYLKNKKTIKKLNKSLYLLQSDEQKIHNENFNKFLSDSRDWAFSYIEDVQNGLKKFIDNVGPEVEYYEKYGIVIEGMMPTHDKALTIISKEFKDLKTLLPEEKE